MKNFVVLLLVAMYMVAATARGEPRNKQIEEKIKLAVKDVAKKYAESVACVDEDEDGETYDVYVISPSNNPVEAFDLNGSFLVSWRAYACGGNMSWHNLTKIDSMSPSSIEHPDSWKFIVTDSASGCGFSSKLLSAVAGEKITVKGNRITTVTLTHAEGDPNSFPSVPTTITAVLTDARNPPNVLLDCKPHTVDRCKTLKEKFCTDSASPEQKAAPLCK